MEENSLCGIKIIVNEYLPLDTIVIAPDLKKFFDAVLNGDTAELDKQRADLSRKIAIIRDCETANVKGESDGGL